MGEEEKVSVFRTVKIVSSTIVPLVAVMGALWAIDNHYASAADVQVMQRSLETQVRSLRIERTEDEIFKLDMKRNVQRGRLSPEDEALYLRYTRKLNDANKEQRSSDAAAQSAEIKK